MKEESTHLVFDGKSMVVSPDIIPVFSFLMEIEKEIDSLLGVNNKITSIRENYLEMISFVEFLSNKLKENDIDFEFTFKESPDKIADKLNFHIPLRSQTIVLFASLEVLFSLHMAYENETDNEINLRRLIMDTDNTKKFLNTFILNEENEYYKNNRARFSKIDSTKLRNLRNSLTHFFSIGHGGLSLSPDLLSKEARSFENILKQNKKGHIVFVSPEDLYGLIKGANMLRMKKWSEDFHANSKEFKRRMNFVIGLVKKEGAVILKKN